MGALVKSTLKREIVTCDSSPIVWIDCEMTGLDQEIDELCEVAVVITDSNLVPMDEGIDLVIKPSDRAMMNMGSFVRNMHKNSGLLPLIEQGISIEDAAEQILAYIKERVPESRKAPLGGNSVGTDKVFLTKQMPGVIEHLHYRIIDVSSIKELAKRWYPRAYFASPEKVGNHRAIGDIFDSIDELRYYKSVLFPDGEGPTTEESREIATTITESRTQDSFTEK